MQVRGFVATIALSFLFSSGALAERALDDPQLDDAQLDDAQFEPIEVVEVEQEVTTKTERRSRRLADDGPAERKRERERQQRREREVVLRPSRPPPPPPREPAVFDSWARHASFFVGGVGGMAFAPGAIGPAGTLGVELGVAAKSGVGFGMHMLALANPPAVPTMNLPKAAYGFGAAADLRWYIQTIEPLTLYPAVSLGFAAGPAESTGRNAVLPLFNLGFGARMTFGQVYVAAGLGVTGVFIPFLNLSVGWTPGAKA